MDKAGTEGTKIELTANYFPIKQKPGSEIHEYSVKVEPTVDDKKTRLRLIASVKERIGSYIYSGANILYTFQRINETSTQFEWQAELESKRYVLLIDHRGKIDLTSGEALQVMNILLRRAMKGLELQSVGRHLFDAKSAVSDSVNSIPSSLLCLYMCVEKSECNQREQKISNKKMKWEIDFSLQIREVKYLWQFLS